MVRYQRYWKMELYGRKGVMLDMISSHYNLNWNKSWSTYMFAHDTDEKKSTSCFSSIKVICILLEQKSVQTIKIVLSFKYCKMNTRNTWKLISNFFIHISFALLKSVSQLLQFLFAKQKKNTIRKNFLPLESNIKV